MPLIATPASQDSDHRQAEDRDHQQLWRPEDEYDRSGGKAEKRQERRSDKTSEQRRCEGGGQGAGRFAAFRHREPIKHGRLGRTRSRYTHEYRCKGVRGRNDGDHSHHQCETRKRLHAEHERQEQGKSGDSSQARQDADSKAHADAKDKISDDERLQYHAERISERRQC